MTDDTLNIKDAFYKLIKLKKELHNNILAYQPLCIESLHAMLKKQGFKCKMNTLMDFLDEQVIFLFLNTWKNENTGLQQIILFAVHYILFSRNEAKKKVLTSKSYWEILLLSSFIILLRIY